VHTTWSTSFKRRRLSGAPGLIRIRLPPGQPLLSLWTRCRRGLSQIIPGHNPVVVAGGSASDLALWACGRPAEVALSRQADQALGAWDVLRRFAE
jgi:hypothetical protein